MTTITEQRQAVAGLLATALPGCPVYASPPANVTAPAAFVQLGEATAQPLAGRWNANLFATIVAGAGDSEATVLTLEQMILDAAREVSQAMTTPVTWERPGQTTIAGTTYLAARLVIPIDIES